MRRRLQDAVPENADAISAPYHGAVCDGKPGLRCTVFEAPIVYGAIGDGEARRTFLYYQNVGSIGPLLDAAQSLPEPLLSVGHRPGAPSPGFVPLTCLPGPSEHAAATANHGNC